MARFSHTLVHLLVWIGLLCGLGVSAGGVWLATGERSLMPIVPWVQKLSGNDRWHVTDMRGHITGFTRTLEVQAFGLQITQLNSPNHITFSEITAGVDMLSLIAGKLVFNHVLVKQPQLLLVRDVQGLAFAKSQAEESATVEAPPLIPLIMGWLGMGDQAANLPTIKRLFLRSAELRLEDRTLGVHILAPAADVELERQKNGQIVAQLSTEIMIMREGGGYEEGVATPPIRVSGQWRLPPQTQRLEGGVRFEGVDPTHFAALHASLAPLAGMKMLLDGKLEMLAQLPESLTLLQLELHGKEGSFTHTPWFKNAIALDRLQLRVSLTDNAQSLLLDGLEIDSAGTSITAKGLVSPMLEGKRSAQVEAAITQASVADIERLWPLVLYPESRAWFVERVQKGQVPQAGIVATLTVPQQGTSVLDTMQAKLSAEGVDVMYHPKLALLKEAQATLEATKELLIINVTQGSIGDMRVTSGTVSIPTPLEWHTRLKIEANLEGAAKEAAILMKPEVLAFVTPLQLAGGEGIVGGVSGALMLDFPMAGDALDLDNMLYHVQAKAKEVTIPKLLGKFPVQKGTGEITADNQGLKVQGEGLLAGESAKITYEETYGAQAASALQLHYRTTPQALATLGITLPSEVSGMLAVTGSIAWKGEEENGDFNVDLADAALDLSDFAYIKPTGEAAKARFKTHQKKSTPWFEISDGAIEGKKLEAAGRLRLHKTEGTLQQLNITKGIFGENNLRLNYTHEKNMRVVDLQGKHLNIGRWLERLDASGDAPLPALQANVALDTLAFGEGRVLKKVSGEASCSEKMCLNARAKAEDSKGTKLRYQLGFNNGIRAVTVNAEDAGELLRVLDISPNIHGGTLELSAAFADDKPARPLIGVLTMRNYKSMGAPVLAKLLNVASLSGIGELLSGEGIAFDLLTAPFSFSGGQIHVKEAKTVGGSLGITARGTIDTAKKQMDLDGTLIPSYTINSFLGNIPLIGEALVGEGVFGFTYTIKGSYQEAEVAVNPLSILAPGFLRGLFEGTDRVVEEKAK